MCDLETVRFTPLSPTSSVRWLRVKTKRSCLVWVLIDLLAARQGQWAFVSLSEGPPHVLILGLFNSP